MLGFKRECESLGFGNRFRIELKWVVLHTRIIVVEFCFLDEYCGIVLKMWRI